MFSRIVVLCTGNICRSPIGEILLRARLEGRDRHVCSAGTHAVVGAPAEADAQRVVRDIGMDLSAHVAQQATPELLRWADLILIMDSAHRRWIDSNHPQLRGRAFMITHWDGGDQVEDPYLLPTRYFERARDQMARGVESWLPHL